MLDVGHPVGDRERELLDRGRAGLTDVVAADRDRVPAGHLAGPEFDRVGDEPHRLLRREQEFLLGDEFLEDVVLERSLESRPRDAGLLGGDDVHRPDGSGRTVDRHRRRDALEGQIREQDLHVGEAADADAACPELALGLGIVGVVTVERRHVVGDREAGLAGGKQRLEPGVRVLGRSEPGELPHRPQQAPVHRGLHTAGVRKLTGVPEVLLVIEVRKGIGGVKNVDLLVGDGRESLEACR